MKQKTLVLVLTLQALVCMTISILDSTVSNVSMYILTFPLEPIGIGLRALSLSGLAGDIAASTIYVCFGLLPILYLIIRIKKKTAKPEDILLVVLSILIFVALYHFVNPFYFTSLFGIMAAGKMIVCITIYTVLVGYIAIKLLRRYLDSDTRKLLSHLKSLIAVICVIIVFDIFGSGLSNLIATFGAVQSANTDPAVSLTVTYVFLVVRYLNVSAVSLVNIIILFFASRLIDELKSDRYGDGVVLSANKLFTVSKRAVVFISLSFIFINLMQLLVIKSLHSSDFTANIPLVPLLLVLIMMVLSKYFAESKEIKSENDMFI